MAKFKGRFIRETVSRTVCASCYMQLSFDLGFHTNSTALSILACMPSSLSESVFVSSLQEGAM